MTRGQWKKVFTEFLIEEQVFTEFVQQVVAYWEDETYSEWFNRNMHADDCAHLVAVGFVWHSHPTIPGNQWNRISKAWQRKVKRMSIE